MNARRRQPPGLVMLPSFRLGPEPLGGQRRLRLVGVVPGLVLGLLVCLPRLVELAVGVAVVPTHLDEALADQPAQPLERTVPRPFRALVPARRRVQPGKPPNVPNRGRFLDVDVRQQPGRNDWPYSRNAAAPGAGGLCARVCVKSARNLLFERGALAFEPTDYVMRLARLDKRAGLVC